MRDDLAAMVCVCAYDGEWVDLSYALSNFVPHLRCKWWNIYFKEFRLLLPSPPLSSFRLFSLWFNVSPHRHIKLCCTAQIQRVSACVCLVVSVCTRWEPEGSIHNSHENPFFFRVFPLDNRLRVYAHQRERDENTIEMKANEKHVRNKWSHLLGSYYYINFLLSLSLSLSLSAFVFCRLMLVWMSVLSTIQFG